MRIRNKLIVKIISGLIICFLLLAEIQVVLFFPQDAKADLPSKALETGLVKLDAIGTNVGVNTAVIANPPSTFRIIMENAARGAASALINLVVNRFVSKLIQKYKIRNYLYYDQILTNYYLDNYIRDKIADPDLRKIYTLLEAAYVSGQPTGTTGAPDPTKALIPQLKAKIYQYYLDSGGIPTETVYNPPASMSDKDYFSYVQSYYLNPPSHTEMALRGQFGAFQSSATTAAQLEVIVGNGLKASRYVGGTCESYNFGPYQPEKNPTISPANCAAAGGVWKESALDKARSFIDNPSAFVEKYLQSGLNQIMVTNYDPNNFWFVIGQAAGSFLFTQLSLDKNKGDVLMEDPSGYQSSNAPNNPPSIFNGIDIDGDGTPDGYDTDNDGNLDICIYGGTAPNCTGSVAAMTPPKMTPPSQTQTCFTNMGVPSQYNSQVSQVSYGALQNNPASAAALTNKTANPNASTDNDILIHDMISNLKGMGLRAGRAMTCNNTVSDDKIMVGGASDPAGEIWSVWNDVFSPDPTKTFSSIRQVSPIEITDWSACENNCP